MTFNSLGLAHTSLGHYEVGLDYYEKARALSEELGDKSTLNMALIYVAPPALTIFAQGAPRWLGLLAWAAMALSFQPTLRFYRLSPLWGWALPGIASLYLFFTLDSAWQHRNGRGGMWKGRAQAPGAGAA